MKFDFYIGIDPGNQNGFAVWSCREKQLKRLKTFSVMQIITELENYKKEFGDTFCVILEATYLNRAVWIPTNNRKNFSKIARNVGMNQQTAKFIRDFCKDRNIELIESKPGKKSHTKLDSQQFERITGYRGRISQHARDAAMLIFGRN